MMKKKEENTLAKNQRKINELAALFPEETVQEEGNCDCDLWFIYMGGTKECRIYS